MTTATYEAAPPINMQGVLVPQTSVNGDLFMERTNRQVVTERTPTAFSGLGLSDSVALRRSGILARAKLRFTGSLVTAKGTGAIGTTGRWPLDLPKRIRVSANEQSGLINCSGAKLKMRELAHDMTMSDRAVSQLVGGVARTIGTFATPAESWGVGSLATNIADGTYPVELEWSIPICDDETDLAGALFLPTTATDVEIGIDWNDAGTLFTLTNNAAVTLTGNWSIEVVKYSVPEGADGEVIVPDLSMFHQLIENRAADAPANGNNEVRLSGQGPGKTLTRIAFQVWNTVGGVPTPLGMTAANFGPISWLYSTNQEPDRFLDGTDLREWNTHLTSNDLGGVWGFGVHEFAAQNALRDSVDLGTHGEVRINFNVQAGVALTTPRTEVVQELLFHAG